MREGGGVILSEQAMGVTVVAVVAVVTQAGSMRAATARASQWGVKISLDGSSMEGSKKRSSSSSNKAPHSQPTDRNWS